MKTRAHKQTRTSIGLCTALLTCHASLGLPGSAFEIATAADHFARRGANAEQPAPELHYTDHHRNAFAIASKMGQLRFDLNAPRVGLADIRPNEQPGLVAPGSLSFKVTLPGGDEYESQLASRPARINVFRHGPHYIDARVFDLVPTNDKNQQIPVKGELIFHIWSRRLYVEAKLHAEKKIPIRAACLTVNLEGRAIEQTVLGSGEAFTQAVLPMQRDQLSGKDWFGFVGRGQTLAYSVPAPDGTQAISVDRTGDRIQIVQQFLLKEGEESNALSPGHPISVAARLHVGGGGSLDAMAHEVALESNPLTARQFTVGKGTTFSGYNARTGYYTIGTARPESLRWLYEHASVISTAPLSIHNDGAPRVAAIRHENTSTGGRLGAGIVTDADGRSLPLLVQNSKNFRGEDEEPFYNPGDPEYNESYFVLPLRGDEHVRLQSHHTFQNWGNFAIKQVGSLQAWMHYYQMSLGVTETTCHVPFRFGGHGGIWIADLRGISGQMWPGRGQPQYDNVGGHRVFHYRDASGDHFTRYLRTRFRSTGPNLADWSMDYVTDGGEARLSLDIVESPQTDVTRCFMTMRVEFDKTLSIQDARNNLRLVSLDTTTQRLRYNALGYTDINEDWQSLDPGNASLPIVAQLAQSAPLVAFSGNRKDSHQHGNNAILIQRFDATAGGQPLKRLTTGMAKRGKGERIIWISPDADTIEFRRGDFLELDFVVIPFGHIGDGPEAALAERKRFGENPPRVTAHTGRTVDHFPARVAATEDERASFSLRGGFGVMPVLVEGFSSHVPPRFEVRHKDGDWEQLVMGAGNRGHQVYPTGHGKFGFVLLVDTDGRPLLFRVGRDSIYPES